MLVQTTAATIRNFGSTSHAYSRAALPEDQLESLAVIIGRRLSLYMDAHLSSLAEENGIPLMDFKALAYIVEFQSLPTGQLVRLMGLSPGGTTALINRLEAGGFITRDRDKYDRRVVALKPIAERCAGLVFSGDGLARHIAAASEFCDEPGLEGIRDFLTCFLNGLKVDTQSWLMTATKEGSAQAV